MVRARAIEWIRGLGSDELISFLPQLVQAVKHEAWDISPTAELLLERALTSPRLAHHLYWLLNQCLPLQVCEKKDTKDILETVITILGISEEFKFRLKLLNIEHFVMKTGIDRRMSIS